MNNINANYACIILLGGRVLNKNIERSDKGDGMQVSRRHKRKMNRIFRDIAKTRWVPYPEADNVFEKFRAMMLRWIGRGKLPK